jgi:hypothetical protein
MGISRLHPLEEQGRHDGAQGEHSGGHRRRSVTARLSVDGPLIAPAETVWPSAVLDPFQGPSLTCADRGDAHVLHLGP